jgi:DNA repair exonuclease SbcCD ATPase subunit
MERGMKVILETVVFIKERVEQLPTEERVREITREVIRDEVPGMIEVGLKPIRTELKEIREELDELQEKVGNVSGFRKEIDHALERIAAIEKQLGLEKKMAA